MPFYTTLWIYIFIYIYSKRFVWTGELKHILGSPRLFDPHSVTPAMLALYSLI